MLKGYNIYRSLQAIKPFFFLIHFLVNTSNVMTFFIASLIEELVTNCTFPFKTTTERLIFFSFDQQYLHNLQINNSTSRKFLSHRGNLIMQQRLAHYRDLCHANSQEH